ncbi:MAG: MTH938/NDUFAF3 family protein [Candidatus Aenigmarchaeota archaeon]|nr:MTH938/NDUFAF3 family protein [Candidatus Aenigmarchaeota archaeon]
MIESYEFGRIVINGKEYTNDVIIFPNRVINWWRKEGHKLQVEDIEEITKVKPKILIVGTGYSGMMEIVQEVREYLNSNKVELKADITEKACEMYNKFFKTKKVVAALHLTC